MNDNKDREERFFITFADVLAIFRRSKMKIFCWAVTLALLGFIFALTRPILYESEGTFREKSIKPSNISNSLLELLGSGSGIMSGSESEAMSMIKSRKIMNEVVNKLHLQGHLEEKSETEGTLKRMFHNFQIGWNSFWKKSHPPIKDICCSLKIKALEYTGEVPQGFKIDLRVDGTYEVRQGWKLIGEGRLNKPFVYQNVSWTLVPSTDQAPIVAKTFHLNVDSMANTVVGVSKQVEVEISKHDKNILELSYKNRNRHSACAVVNTLMDCYQDYLRNHHKNLALLQLDYLGFRRDHLTSNLTSLMEEHANFLSNDLYNAGFLDTDKEMDFLAKSQHEFKEKLLANELEIKRLENFKPSTVVYYDRYSSMEGDPAVINTILADIRKLKQDRDTLEIELQKKSAAHGLDLHRSFELQLEELGQVQQYIEEIHEISVDYQAGKLPDPDSKLMNDPRFQLKGWFERLQKAGSSTADQLTQTKESFQYYLNNLERLFGVYQRILQERLTHQQNPTGEYKGITYDVATNLYLEYSKQQIEIEAMIRQNQFFISQIEDPSFEITSLSGGLTDAVSNDMIRKASELVLNLRDQNNQSQREQERIKEELTLQRTFLMMHLKQMVQLMELKKQLVDEKIFALQNVSLELIHQQISLAEKNLQDYVKSRLYNLQEEKELIKRHLEGINFELATLPKKWVAEQLIEQEVATNQLIVEEIAKMVESKNISHNLEVIQSSPIDRAIPAVHPKSPKLLLWGIVGFIFGGMLGTGIALGQTVSKGLSASPEGLRLMGYHVSGQLTSPLYSPATDKLKEANLSTLRLMQSYFDPPRPMEHRGELNRQGGLLLLLEGKGPDYLLELAELFTKKGDRVLMLDLNFTASGKVNGSRSDLYHYLKGEIEQPTIHTGSQGDWITAGGMTSYGNELLVSPAFRQLIDGLKGNYDWILAKSAALPCSVDGENLLALFPCAVVTLHRETIEELGAYTWFSEKRPRTKLTFVFSED